jgi:molybdopterin converting factor subunit 1
MRILLFSQLKDVAGKSQLEWSLNAPVTIEQLWEWLLHEHPALAAYRSIVRVAKNREYTGADEVFGETDEVALIPPVSGG